MSRSTRTRSSTLTSSHTAARSTASTPHSETLFELREKVSVADGERMLRSPGFQRFKESNETEWANICATLSLAQALGGYVPVRYYMHEAQEGYGRMKCEVMADGLATVPYVRMSRHARAVLAGAHYWDVDMENCQPSLLFQKLAQHSIPCPLLERYVADRDECLRDVMDGCNVSRDEAKKLLLRVMYFGGVDGWLEEVPHASPTGVPQWVRSIRGELREAAKALLVHPTLSDLNERLTRRNVAMLQHNSDASPSSADPIASVMAIYLQTLECECVRSLIKAVQADCRAVGGIIYDGILVAKADGETAPPPATQLAAWEDAVKADTGLVVRLKVKPLDAANEWMAPLDDGDEKGWMKGRHLLPYQEVKRRWEARAFKVIKSGNYVIEGDTRAVMSERQLMESYRHLHFSDLSVQDTGRVKVLPAQPFVSRWIKDPTIRTYDDMVFRPPPLTTPADSYNIWNGFDVEGCCSTKSELDAAWGGRWHEHPAVVALRDFRHRLLGGAVAEYVIKFEAQMYQRPATKTGTSVILMGEEGTGKNFLLDLHRDMMGRDKFLQTATPSTSLYGRFNRLREGRVLIVINEANGADNFAANDVIKDMITCDEFVSEGKGTNSYTMNCHARFIFTTNNLNAMRVNPDSRRYVVVEVSSALKGNTEYFRDLAALYSDGDNRYAFYRYLMEMDIASVDWINERPITEYMLQMVSMNLPYEHQFFKAVVLKEFVDRQLRVRVDAPVLKINGDDMYEQFIAWTQSNRVRYDTTPMKFGVKMSKLVRDVEKKTGFVGLQKVRHSKGMVYKIDVRRLVAEMIAQRWMSSDEV